MCKAPGASWMLSKRWLGGLGAAGTPWSVEENRYDQACSTNVAFQALIWALGPQIKTKSNQALFLPSLQVLARPVLHRLDSVSTVDSKSAMGVLGDEM